MGSPTTVPKLLVRLRPRLHNRRHRRHVRLRQHSHLQWLLRARGCTSVQALRPLLLTSLMLPLALAMGTLPVVLTVVLTAADTATATAAFKCLAPVPGNMCSK